MFGRKSSEVLAVLLLIAGILFVGIYTIGIIALVFGSNAQNIQTPPIIESQFLIGDCNQGILTQCNNSVQGIVVLCNNTYSLYTCNGVSWIYSGNVQGPPGASNATNGPGIYADTCLGTTSPPSLSSTTSHVCASEFLGNFIVCELGSTPATYGNVYECTRNSTAFAWSQTANLNGPTGPTGPSGAAGNCGAGGDGEVCAWDTITSVWTGRGNPVFYGANTQTNSGTDTITFGYNATTTASIETIAIGYEAFANSNYSVVIGPSATTSTTGIEAIAIGQLATATADSGVAIGIRSRATGLHGIAIGGRANTGLWESAIAIGYSSVTNGDAATVIGTLANGNGFFSVAAGFQAAANNLGAIAIGAESRVDSQYGIAVGYQATTGTTGTDSIAIGLRSNATGSLSVGIGREVKSTNVGTIAIGTLTEAIDDFNIAIGFEASANLGGSMAIGLGATAETEVGLGGICIGTYCFCKAEGSLAIGSFATTETTGLNSVAIGTYAAVIEGYSVALGFSSVTEGIQGVAIGAFATTAGSTEFGTAVGSYSYAVGFGTTIGATATAGFRSLAAGFNARAESVAAIAVGYRATTTGTTGERAIAIGNEANASSIEAIGIGNFVLANAANSVVIGASATANSVIESIALGNAASPADAAHAFALSINVASVLPGSIGSTVNGVPSALWRYSSLWTTSAEGSGTTILTEYSAQIQTFTAAQTVILPVVSTLQTGFTFKIANTSGGNVIVQTSGGNTKITLLAGTFADLVCISTSGTGTASWNAYQGGNVF